MPSIRRVTDSATKPAVSIVLPTYNRVRFLDEAIASIYAQSFVDWELIIVDDGSTDGTRDLIDKRCAGIAQPVCYVYQENQGAYGARNTGLDLCRGRYITFFDSDDLWLPHHLADCVAALNTNPDVDWVYGAGRHEDHGTGRIINSRSFYVDGRPRPFLRLDAEARGDLKVLLDPQTLRCMVLHGLYCGLQNSVIRAGVFAGRRFRTHFRNEAEDQLFVIRALAGGCRFGYFDDVHVVYRVHDENSSAASPHASQEQRITVFRALARGYEELLEELRLTPAERRAVWRRLGRVYFWVLGYALLWQTGRRPEALSMLRKGLGFWPWDAGCWKTYLLLRLRTFVGF